MESPPEVHIPLNALLISENFPPVVGGSSRWFWELYRRLPHDQLLVAAGESSEAQAFDRTHQLPLRRLPLTMPRWDLLSSQGLAGYWKAWQSLRSLVAAEQPRLGRRPVVHAARCLPEGWLAWLLHRSHGFPYIVYAHGEDVTTAQTSRQYRAMVRRVFARARGVVANSHNTAQLLRDGWRLPANNVHVLHPGVDTQQLRPASTDAAFRHSLGWEERTVILTVGRLQRRKGHDFLIEALADVCREHPDLLYAIVGEGEERPRLQALVEQLRLEQHVQFLGNASDDALARYYQQCDIFALPNRTLDHDIEGFGMVLLEAQAAGKPVLAGDSGGTREAFLPGTTGWLADCSSPQHVSLALRQVLEARPSWPAMGCVARAHVEARFDWSQLAREALELFQRITLDDSSAGAAAARSQQRHAA